jgi:hypothetical protein
LRISFSALSASSSSHAWRSPTRRRVKLLGQPIHDVARLVNLASLDQAVLAEGRPDRLGKRLCAVVSLLLAAFSCGLKS